MKPFNGFSLLHFITALALGVTIAHNMRQDDQIQTLALQLQKERQTIMAQDLLILDANKQLRDYQQWRVQITLASRMGWTAATRYIRNYPLDLHEAMAP